MQCNLHTLITSRFSHGGAFVCYNRGPTVPRNPFPGHTLEGDCDLWGDGDFMGGYRDRLQHPSRGCSWWRAATADSPTMSHWAFWASGWIRGYEPHVYRLACLRLHQGYPNGYVPLCSSREWWWLWAHDLSVSPDYSSVRWDSASVQVQAAQRGRVPEKPIFWDH